jgi:hypothetical protein
MAVSRLNNHTHTVRTSQAWTEIEKLDNTPKRGKMAANNHRNQRHRSRGRTTSRPEERTKQLSSKPHRGRSRNDGRRREYSNEAEIRSPSRHSSPRVRDKSGATRDNLRHKQAKASQQEKVERHLRRSKTRSKSQHRISADIRDREPPAGGRREQPKRHQRGKDQITNKVHRERKHSRKENNQRPVGKREILVARQSHRDRSRSRGRKDREFAAMMPKAAKPKKGQNRSRSKRATTRTWGDYPEELPESESTQNVTKQPATKWFSRNKIEKEEPQTTDVNKNALKSSVGKEELKNAAKRNHDRQRSRNKK